MAEAQPQRTPPDRVVAFFARTLALAPPEFTQAAEPQSGEPPPELEMSAVVSLKNQPEFWADAPWRLEPDQAALPVSFHIRDAHLDLPKRGRWRLDALRVEQRLPNEHWRKLAVLLPSQLPGVDDQGWIQEALWVHGIAIPRSQLHPTGGAPLHLRVRFEGSFPPHAKPNPVNIHLETQLAETGLPQGRAAYRAGPRRWFYGDTHYHSAYTNDIKEFGGAVTEARRAGRAIGLDWLIVTDHSCDLNAVDAGVGGARRWDRLKAELHSPLSNGRFRFILGEEITLLNEAGLPVHLLAFGALEEMVPGAFLPASSGKPSIVLARAALEAILKASEGYPEDTPQRLFGPMLTLEQVLAALPAGTLAFAAHPFSVAQVPPAKWGQGDLAQRRLTGYEFWNARIRVKGSRTTNPFRRPTWRDAGALQRADADRIAALQKHAREGWDPQMMAGVLEWDSSAALPARRPVFIGGADAHGDFNYHVGWAWDYRRFEVDDNALGRVRTAILMPAPVVEVPGVPEILAALKRGACVVTDGPLLEPVLEHAAGRAGMGEALTVAGAGDLVLRIRAHSTPDFGSVREAEVVTGFPRQPRDKPRHTVVAAGVPATVALEGSRGYIRVEAQTTGARGEGFCCFTNPIFVQRQDSGPRSLRVLLESEN